VTVSKAEQLLGALSRVIRKKREEAGLSQTELAERSNLHRTYISNIERGAQNVSIEILSRISEALNSSIGELISAAEADTRQSTARRRILLVEDNPADVYMFQRCLARSPVPIDLKTLDTGQKASEYLNGLNGGETELPEIIFLDLNLPGKSGHEILHQLKSNEHLKHIPVIVMTTSANPDDVQRSYGQFVNSYLTKPVDPLEFEDSIGRVLSYWFRTSLLPTRKATT
jgi:Response regulator containing a CheY-like receiver domain and an HD-GYP domain